MANLNSLLNWWQLAGAGRNNSLKLAGWNSPPAGSEFELGDLGPQPATTGAVTPYSGPGAEFRSQDFVPGGYGGGDGTQRDLSRPPVQDVPTIISDWLKTPAGVRFMRGATSPGQQ